MKSSDEDMERLLLRYFVNDEWAARGSQPLSSIFDQIARPSGWRDAFFDQLTSPVEKGALSAILERMAKDGLLRARNSGDHEPHYEAAHDVLTHPRYDYLFPKNASRNSGGDGELTTGLPDHHPFIESKRWTGTQFVLIDGEVLEQARRHARELHQTVQSMHFSSNSESQDVKALADALLAICFMTEPEVTLLDRILASPKFKAYARLFGIVAMIRGATGI